MKLLLLNEEMEEDDDKVLNLTEAWLFELEVNALVIKTGMEAKAKSDATVVKTEERAMRKLWIPMHDFIFADLDDCPPSTWVLSDVLIDGQGESPQHPKLWSSDPLTYTLLSIIGG